MEEEYGYKCGKEIVKGESIDGWYIPLVASLITFILCLIAFGICIHYFAELEMTTQMVEINKTLLDAVIIP